MANSKKTNDRSIDLTLGHSDLAYNILRFPKVYRGFFPGYKTPFVLESNVGQLELQVTSAPKDTEIGDPDAGNYIVGGLREWYDHNQVQEGNKVRVTEVKKHKKYELNKLRSR